MQKPNRLDQLDGLRAFAALGVLWIHTWTLFGNPNYKIWYIDISKILAIGGNGVDFFFVISGFCMYYFYGAKNVSLSFYKKYFIKRYLRIAPAFYLCLIFILFLKLNIIHDLAEWSAKLLANLFFVQNIIPNTGISAHFWSIAVEIHFYIILPILIWCFKKYGFLKTFIIFLILSFVLGGLLLQFYPLNRSILHYQITIRLPQFLCGILAGYLVLNKDIFSMKQKKYLYSTISILFGVILMYFFRFFLTDGILKNYATYYGLLKMIGLTFMTFGFMIILVNVIINPSSLVAKILSSKFLSFLGRISYSFYLWHIIVIVNINSLMQPFNIQGMKGACICFFISIFILIPISYISYRFIEIPFQKFNKKIK